MIADTVLGGLIGAGAAFGGVAATAIVAALRERAAFRREKRWTSYEARRAHLEQIYTTAEEHREAYRRAMTNAIGMLGGVAISREWMMQVPTARLRMLVHLYEPDLIPELARLERAAEAFGAAIADAVAKTASADQQVRGGATARLTDAHNAANAAYDRFVAAVVAESYELHYDAAEAMEPSRLTVSQRLRLLLPQRLRPHAYRPEVPRSPDGAASAASSPGATDEQFARYSAAPVVCCDC
jgi:hypothetical protein